MGFGAEEMCGKRSTSKTAAGNRLAERCAAAFRRGLRCEENTSAATYAMISSAKDERLTVAY